MSYISSWLHCVFSTKERRPLITPPLRERLWPFLGGIARQNRMKAIEIGGTLDHVHILASMPATLSIAQALQLLKGASLRDKAPSRPRVSIHDKPGPAPEELCPPWEPSTAPTGGRVIYAAVFPCNRPPKAKNTQRK